MGPAWIRGFLLATYNDLDIHNDITSTPVDIKFCKHFSPDVSQASPVETN